MTINTKDFIQVGRIGRPKGTKGLLRFQSYLHDDREINDIKVFYLESEKKIEIKLKSFDNKGPLITINTFDNRNEVESFVNSHVYLEKKDLEKPSNKDEFYIYELEGLDVISQKNKVVGVVHSAVNFGAGDLLEIYFLKSKKREFIRFTKDEFPEVDISNKKIFIKN